MMRKFLALLLLAAAPAFAQEYNPLPPPPLDPVVEQTFTVVKEQETIPLQNINQNGGIPLTLYDDGVTYQPIPLQFDFYYFGNLFRDVYVSQNGFISFTSNANGCCSGNPLPYLSNDPYYNLNNTIFAMWSDLIDFQFGNPFYKSTGNAFTVGWYGVEELGSAGYTCDQMGCRVTGLPNKFNFEISLFPNSDFSINYGSFDYHNQTWRSFTSGFQGDTTTEFHQIYYGNQPQSLQNTTYTVLSSEIVPIQPPTSTVDCVQQPLSATCVLTTLNIGSTTDTTNTSTDTSTSTEETTSTASNTTITESTPTESSTTEIVANTSTPVESFSSQEKVADPVVAAVPTPTADPVAALVASANPVASAPANEAVYRELTAEEKAAILADAISKNVIEGALTNIAATSAASASNGSQDGSTSTVAVASKTSNTETASDNTGLVADNSQQTSQSDTQDMNVGLDVLDTGRAMGQQTLSTVLATSTEFADQAGQQAESIAQTSAVSTQNQVDFIAKETTQDLSIDIPSLSQDIQTAEQTVMDMIVAAVDNALESVESVVTDDGRPKEIPGLANSMEIEQQTLAVLDAIKQSSEPTFDDDSKQFEEAIVSNNFDPQAAAAFGSAPSVANLEILGVIGNSKPEEKSDAEKRAEQIVAANQQQMEEINKNYMDADQSGIIGAIGADGADVTTYRTTMIADASQWYRDKDIYKGVVIKDNVRGSYFLEKGNTDLYKKLIEEQYK